MNLYTSISNYVPFNEQEQIDKNLILSFLNDPTIFHRTNTTVHFTAAGWIVNKQHTKVLFAYHNIYDSWAWTGGHADGDTDLLRVAIKEAREETGITHLHAIEELPFSIEILPVAGHFKKGKYVSSHLHINCTYLLEADEADTLQSKPDENSGVEWFTFDEIFAVSKETWMKENIYRKLNDKFAQFLHKNEHTL